MPARPATRPTFFCTGKKKMAKVRMIQTYSVQDIQESFDYVYEYTYCDECGSFDIETSSSLPEAVSTTLVVITMISFLAAIVVVASFTAIWYYGCLLGLLGVLSFIIVGATGRYQCRKCGNRRISPYNTLQYRENDKSVLDVPESSIKKERVDVRPA
jgi:hypothetical protein